MELMTCLSHRESQDTDGLGKKSRITVRSESNCAVLIIRLTWLPANADSWQSLKLFLIWKEAISLKVKCGIFRLISSAPEDNLSWEEKCVWELCCECMTTRMLWMFFLLCFLLVVHFLLWWCPVCIRFFFSFFTKEDYLCYLYKCFSPLFYNIDHFDMSSCSRAFSYLMEQSQFKQPFPTTALHSYVYTLICANSNNYICVSYLLSLNNSLITWTIGYKLCRPSSLPILS